jgi:predicted Zn-dependent peptidase
MHNIQTTDINPNFTVISEFMPNISSAALGVFFFHGSRYENKENQGITNMISQMLFKGTLTKTAKEISYIIESAGAVLDNFTTKETSGIYCRYHADQFDLMVDLIGELISQSTFDKQELEREKNVVEQEIAESFEDPHEHVFNLLFEVLLNDHPLSYPITGTVETIRSITRDQLNDYYHNRFLRSKVCISAAGKVNHKELVEKLALKNHILQTTNPIKINKPSTDIERTFLIQNRPDLTQIHVTAASFTIPYSDSHRYELIILNNLLGGTMSSRLFQRIREEEGIVYTISSFVDLYSDIGIMGVYYVTDVNNYERVVKTGTEVVMKLKQDGITNEEFERAINLSKGMLAIGAENPMSRMIRNAKNKLLLGRVIPIEESIVNFDNLKIDDINKLTEEIKPDKYSIAIVGKAKQIEESLAKLTRPGKVIVRN